VVIPDLFAALINSIVAQQISSKAAATVWGRLCVILGDITPVSITNASLEDIQKCGMSVRKASYIKIIGDAVSCGELNISEFPNMSDDEITQRLSALHGIGVWTAEMLLIFSMQRPNVVSWGDLAIRRGMCNLYGHKKLDRVKFEKYKKRYSPYGSVASLYLWAVSVEE
jgi:DNA-3-methyladenine glycosylase II